MALTFPLSYEAFAAKIGVVSMDWTLQDNRTYSGMGSGQIIEADLAPQLRTASATLQPWYADEAAEIEALIEAIVRSKGTFYIADPRKVGPAYDPTGSVLGASTPTISGASGNTSLAITGLPAGYVLTIGDYLSFDYGTPARRAHHRILETMTASGGGFTNLFEVAPFLRQAPTVGTSVTLVRPSFKAMIVPGSVKVSAEGMFTNISFSVMQKL